MASPLTLSIPEAGRQCGVGRTVAYRLAAAGIIPTVRISGTSIRRVPLDAFRLWLKDQGILMELPAPKVSR